MSAVARPLNLRRYIDIATDKYADDASRDGAIEELGWTDDDAAFDALALVAGGGTGDDDMLLTTAGESVAVVWLRRGWYDADVAAAFHETSRQALDAFVAAQCPDAALPRALADAAPHPGFQGPLTSFE